MSGHSYVRDGRGFWHKFIGLIVLANAALSPAFAEPSPPSEFDAPPGIAEDQFYALGYLPGRVRDTRAGVLTNSSAAQPGLNLVISPHYMGAYLMDMSGAKVHEWAHDLWNVWPDDAIPTEIRANKGRTYDYWSRVHLFDNGELIFLHKGCGIFRIDKDSKVQWASWLRAHHDLEVLDNGHIYTLVYSVKGTTGWEALEAEEDFVAELDADGKELRRISIDKALAASDYASLRNGKEDIFLHTNEIVVLDGSWADKHPTFSKGNLLLGCRDISAFVVLDPATEKIVWALSGEWRNQHGPVLLPGHRLLFFDNRGNDGYSRILELDPFTSIIHWKFEGTPRRNFHSEIGGYVQRLPNGNTLITESTKGLAFELTPQEEVVWEFVNPAKNEDGGEISPLFLVHRLTTRPSFLQ